MMLIYTCITLVGPQVIPALASLLVLYNNKCEIRICSAQGTRSLSAATQSWEHEFSAHSTGSTERTVHKSQINAQKDGVTWQPVAHVEPP